MLSLSNATLASCPPTVTRPTYDRAHLRTGIVHLGVGAFHRGHLASYVDQLLHQDPSWGICGVSLRSATTRDALEPQDRLYTLGVRSSTQTQHQIIGALTELIVAPQEPGTLLARLESPDTKIVSLTVTEKGYCHDPATGRLAQNHPDIQNDLALTNTDLVRTKSAIGWLYAGLKRRHEAGERPFTVLSCDNLPANGQTVRQVLLDFIALKDPDLVPWAEAEIDCPSTMVDRIVPATSDADRVAIADVIGVRDAWPIMTEPFSQFVVEDRFTLGRPAWEAVGVTVVQDVEPFEKMKLRMLNGSHSTLAYLGCLAGDVTVADTMADPAFKRLIGTMMREEITPTLATPDQIDPQAYAQALLERFSNKALQHRTAQIAMDGSQKLPQRLLATIAERSAAGQSFGRLALGVSAWMVYALGQGENGQKTDVVDPLSEQFAQIAQTTARQPEAVAKAFFDLSTIFGHELPSDQAFRHTVVEKLQLLFDHGAREAIKRTA